jgi:hypothetical protein
MLKDSKLVCELVMREDPDDEEEVYITFISDDLDVICGEDFPDEATAFAAYPGVSWRAGDQEDGRRVIAVGYPQDEEDTNGS